MISIANLIILISAILYLLVIFVKTSSRMVAFYLIALFCIFLLSQKNFIDGMLTVYIIIDSMRIYRIKKGGDEIVSD